MITEIIILSISVSKYAVLQSTVYFTFVAMFHISSQAVFN